MSASTGNTLWKDRRTHGRRRAFSSSEDLWSRCEAYLDWVDTNPLPVQVRARHRGQLVTLVIHRSRPMSLTALCGHLGITFQTWCNYRHRDDFFDIVTRAEMIIWEQQFTGAAVGLFNPALTARSLGRSRPC